MVLLFSFFFCSGGFLVAHAESVTVVISGSNVTSKPSGWDGNSTYNRVVHYPTTKPEGLLNSYYDALSLSDIGYVTYDTLFQNTGNVQFPYTIQGRLSANFPSVTSWLPTNPHSYTVGSTGASLNYTSIAGAGDMLELVPVSNVLLTPGVHYLLCDLLLLSGHVPDSHSHGHCIRHLGRPGYGNHAFDRLHRLPAENFESRLDRRGADHYWYSSDESVWLIKTTCLFPETAQPPGKQSRGLL